MLNSLVTMLTQSLASTNTTAIQAPQRPISYNPFAEGGQNANPFITTSFKGNENYAKNKPVQGGYFAGYYNGKPNIVGRRLFIEV